MSVQERDRLLECKAVLKQVIVQLEATLGVEAAYPATMALLAAIQEIERQVRE